MQVIEGNMQVGQANIAIVASRFNQAVVNNLIQGATASLQRLSSIESNSITLIKTPGVLEIPLATEKAAQTNKFDAIIVLGAVIKGETSHFDYIAGSCNSLIQSIAIKHSIPITSGILTTENSQQAIERSGLKMGNKGEEAASAALEMISISKKISQITRSKNYEI